MKKKTDHFYSSAPQEKRELARERAEANLLLGHLITNACFGE